VLNLALTGLLLIGLYQFRGRLDWWIVLVFSLYTASVLGWLLVLEIRMRRWLASKDWRVCTKCEYDLSGNALCSVCPECGTPYTHEDLRLGWMNARPLIVTNVMPHDDLTKAQKRIINRRYSLVFVAFVVVSLSVASLDLFLSGLHITLLPDLDFPIVNALSFGMADIVLTRPPYTPNLTPFWYSPTINAVRIATAIGIGLVAWSEYRLRRGHRSLRPLGTSCHVC
jgi:hypothetical protein